MKNFIAGAAQLGETLSVPAGTLSGDPVQLGFLNGCAFNDRDSNGQVVVDLIDNIFSFSVRNVLTYLLTNEATYGAVNVGDKIYFDSTQPAAIGHVLLSTSPLNSAGTANTVYGVAVTADSTVTAKTMTLNVKVKSVSV